MITLYAFGRVHPLVHGLTRDLRVQWALEELELPYHVRGLDHTGGETKTEEFRELSPFQQLPVIEDNGFELAESGAILMYLAGKAGRFPDERTRATVSRWCFAALTTIEPPLQVIGLMDFKPQLDDSEKKQRENLVAWVDRCLTNVQRVLANRAYIAGDDFTVADILLTTVLRMAQKSKLLGSYGALEAYRMRCQARPAWHRTLDAYATRLDADRAAINW